jgi:hypothetical protein
MLIGFGWEARRDEPGREGTLQHRAIAKGYSRVSRPVFYSASLFTSLKSIIS